MMNQLSLYKTGISFRTVCHFRMVDSPEDLMIQLFLKAAYVRVTTFSHQQR